MADSDGKNRQESRGISPKKTASGVFLSVVLALGLSGCGYNTMVSMKEQVQSAWAQVENQLQRRNDLIPNLVETTKGYAAHEKEIFESVANARSKLIGAGTRNDKIEAANEVSSALSRLLALSERYPDLKADKQFARLSDELAGTENRIATERRRYNEVWLRAGEVFRGAAGSPAGAAGQILRKQSALSGQLSAKTKTARDKTQFPEQEHTRQSLLSFSFPADS